MPASRQSSSPSFLFATAAAALVSIVFLGYFRHFREFGFYGDDASFFARAIIQGWSGQWEYLWHALTVWTQGRPLAYGFSLGLLPYLVFSVGSLAGLHFFSFLLVAANVVLLYRLVNRFFPAWTAFCAAGYYGLCPADTVKPSFGYGFCFEISIMVALGASFATLDKKPLRYVLLLATGLLMMEPVVMLPLVVPLVFTFQRTREWLRAAGRHVGLWLLVFVAVLGCRALIGNQDDDGRVAQIVSAPLVTLQRAVTSALTGSRTHVDLWFERIPLPIREIDYRLGLLMGVVMFLSGFALYGQYTAGMHNRDSAPDSSTPSAGAAKLMVAGILLLLATYACYFRDPHYPCLWRHGFMSGVHVIPALGGALLLAGLMGVLAQLATPVLQGWFLALPTVLLTLLAGFGDLVQRDYAASWQFQREFWKAYAVLCADASDRTFVAVLDQNIPQLRFIEPYSWCMEVLPGALYYYRDTPNMGRPSAINRIQAGPGSLLQIPPSVIFTAPDLVTGIKFSEGSYAWKQTYYFMLPKTAQQQPQSGNVIVLVIKEGLWTRVTGDLPVEGGTIHLLDPGPSLLERAKKTSLAAVFGL